MTDKCGDFNNLSTLHIATHDKYDTLQLFWLLWDSTPNITALKLHPFVASYRIDSFFADRNEQGMDNLNRFIHKYPRLTDLGLDFTENTVKVNHHNQTIKKLRLIGCANLVEGYFSKFQSLQHVSFIRYVNSVSSFQ